MALPQQELRVRYETLKDAGLQPLTEQQIESLNATLETDLLEGLEIQLGPNKKTPRCNTYIPRISVLKNNKNKEDTLMSPETAGVPVGSPAFWEQVQLGNVVAFPKGKAEPVQLGLDLSNAGQPKLTATAGLQPDHFPKAPKRPMGFWRWAFTVVTLFIGYWGRRRHNRRVERNHPNVQDKIRQLINDRNETVEQEKEEIRQRQFEKERPARQADYNKAKELVEAKKLGQRNFLSIFRTQPQKLPELVKSENKEGIYTEDHFKDLTVFVKELPPKQEKQLDAMGREIKQPRYEVFDRESVLIGPKNQPLTEEEFAAMGLFATWQPDIQLKFFEASEHYDPSLRQSLLNLNFPKDKIDDVMTTHLRSMATTDNFQPKGRDNEGAWFHLTADPGRRKAAEAFRKYQNGDKEPLAKLIADGVNMASGSFNIFNASDMGYNTYGTALAAKPMLSLMDKDPDLRKLALKKGMDKTKLAVVRGGIKINELETKAHEDYEKIANARLNGEKLSKAQKEEYAKSIIKGRLMVSELRYYGKQSENVPEMKKWDENTIAPDFSLGGMFDQKPDKEHWPMPEKGKIHITFYNEYLGGVKELFAPPNRAAIKMSIPQQQEELDRIAEEMVRQEGMANWSEEDLYKELNSAPAGNRFRMSESLQRAEQNLGIDREAGQKQVNEIVNQNRLNAQNEIQNNELNHENDGPAMQA